MESGEIRAVEHREGGGEEGYPSTNAGPSLRSLSHAQSPSPATAAASSAPGSILNSDCEIPGDAQKEEAEAEEEEEEEEEEAEEVEQNEQEEQEQWTTMKNMSLGRRRGSCVDTAYQRVAGLPPQPARSEWSKARHCKECGVRFALFGRRRHAHCRRCAGAVCRSEACSAHCFWALLTLSPVRTCGQCIRELQGAHVDFFDSIVVDDRSGFNACDRGTGIQIGTVDGGGTQSVEAVGLAAMEEQVAPNNDAVLFQLPLPGGQQRGRPNPPPPPPRPPPPPDPGVRCVPTSAIKLASGNRGRAHLAPVMIIPGFASSVLEVHRSEHKPEWEGEAVWVTMGKLVGKLFTAASSTTSSSSSPSSSSSSSASSSSLSSSTASGNTSVADRACNTLRSTNSGGLPIGTVALTLHGPVMNAGSDVQSGSLRGVLEIQSRLQSKRMFVDGGEAFCTATDNAEHFHARGAGNRVEVTRATGGGSKRMKDTHLDVEKSVSLASQSGVAVPSFRVERKTTAQTLSESHPLVRHLTLCEDGFSDPPGIKVRARQGVEAVMYLSSNPLVGAMSFVFGKLVECVVHTMPVAGYRPCVAWHTLMHGSCSVHHPCLYVEPVGISTRSLDTRRRLLEDLVDFAAASAALE